MKVAITSAGNTQDSILDRHFGRCSFFAIYDNESRTTEFIPNPNKDAIEGAGLASVQGVALHGVNKVVSGEFGAKIKSAFDRLKIQLIVLPDTNITVGEIIGLLQQSTRGKGINYK